MSRRSLAGLWLALFSILAATIAADAAPGRRVALVIGNSAYQNTPTLPNPRNDAQAMAAALKRLGFEVVLALDVAQAQMAAPGVTLCGAFGMPTSPSCSTPGMD